MKVGDPITVVTARPARTYAIKYTVTRVDGDGGFVCDVTTFIDRLAGHASGCNRLLSDEGIDWIHGHHAVESEEVRAVVAAQALVGDTTVSLHRDADELTRLEKQ